MSKPGLDKWYAYMKSHDTAALWDLLHPDAVRSEEHTSELQSRT
mgnify:CR=1 FL=1